MAGIGKFAKPAAGARPPAKKQSRYKGITAATPRDPMPHVGEYRLRVLEVAEGHNPGTGSDSYKVQFAIVAMNEDNDKHAIDDVVSMIQLVSGKAAQSGLSRTKAFVIAAAGFESEEDYDAFDPDGAFIDATTGVQNEYSERGDTLIGRLVDCQVTRGNTTKDGADYYREYAWAAVDEQEQEGVARPGAVDA
jgi:hypothetical protein